MSSEPSSSSSSKVPPGAPTEPKSFRLSSMASRSRLHPNSNRWNRAPSPSLPRHSSSPLVHSPLQQSFPADPDPSKSAPNSPGSASMQETPSRRSRPSEQGVRPRGESRSSSVPVVIRTQQDSETEGEGPSRRSFQSRTRPSSRASSSLPSPADSRDSHNRRSVKHLTCFWWWEKGECKYSEEDCLYAHYDTGHYTAAPRQVIPGEPAKAGRSLERALNKLAITNRSSASVSSLAGANVNNTHCESTGTGSTAVSRPVTPLINHSRPSTPPRMSMDFGHATHLQTDNEFLRSLVQQTQREKRALMDTIETLQTEKSQLNAQIENMSQERDALLTERDILHATIKKLQFPTGANPFVQGHGHIVPLRSPSATTFPSNNPWGAIGSGSRGTTTSPNGTPVDSPAMQPRSFSFAALGAVGPVGSIPNHLACSTARTSMKQPSSDPTLDSTVPIHGSVNGNGVERGSVKADTRLDDTLVSANMEGERLKNLLSSLGPTF